MDIILKDTDTAITTIEASWNKTVHLLLETAQLLIEYQKREDWFQIKAELAARKIMKSEVLSMMMSIGRNTLLNDDNYIKLLPSSYNSLYHLSKMKEVDLKSKLDSGVVTPTTRLIDVRNFSKPKKKKKTASSKKYTKRMSISTTNYKKHKRAIDALIKSISKKYPYISIS